MEIVSWSTCHNGPDLGKNVANVASIGLILTQFWYFYWVMISNVYIYIFMFLRINFAPQRLTYCGLVTPYEFWVNTGSGNGLLPNGTKPLPEPVEFCGIHLTTISQKTLKISIPKMNLKITISKLLPYHPGISELTQYLGSLGLVLISHSSLNSAMNSCLTWILISYFCLSVFQLQYIALNISRTNGWYSLKYIHD